MNPRLISVLLAAAFLLPGGCQMFRLPKLPKSIKDPATRVVAVESVEVGPDAMRAEVVVALTNPNDEPLPLTEARYTLEIAGLGTYKGQTTPNAVVPAEGEITLRLPAAIAGSGPSIGMGYNVGGSIQYFPPGELRHITYDVGVPLPSATFSGKGAVIASTRPAIAPQSAENEPASEARDETDQADTSNEPAP